MSQVKLALNELTLLQQIELARQIAPAMTGNPSFPTPNPPLGDLLDYAATAESTINAQKATAKAAQNATINARCAQIALMNALHRRRQLRAKREQRRRSQNSQRRHESAQRRRTRRPPAYAGEPQGHHRRHARRNRPPLEPAQRRVELRAAIHHRPDDQRLGLDTCPPSTKSKCTLANLTAGTRYWFRVAAAGAAGQGPWSDPATKMPQ